MISIVVAEDDLLLGALVAGLLEQAGEMRIVARAATGPEALAATRRWKPDVLLLDVHLPGCDGWQVLERIRAGRLRSRVVLMSGEYSAEAVARARALGAAEYVEKARAADLLCDLVGRVAAGESWFQSHPAVAEPGSGGNACAAPDAPRARRARGVAAPGSLTDREREVARLVCAGRSNTEIAAALRISRSTVSAHISHMMLKLDVQNRTQLARVVVQSGLLAGK